MPYTREYLELWVTVTNRDPPMEMKLEREDEANLVERVDRLETTLKAVANESQSVTLHGPCPSCEQCLLFLRRGKMYCPHCGDGQNV